LRLKRRGDRADKEVKKEEVRMKSLVKGYFWDRNVWYKGEKLPPQKVNIIMIGTTALFDLDDLEEEKKIEVLGEDENWYTIKKKDINFY